MKDLEQSVICKFIERSCEEDHHYKCAKEYEGSGIKAICICNCHKEKETVPDSKIRARERDDAPVSQKQTSLESFGVDQFVKARRDK